QTLARGPYAAEADREPVAVGRLPGLADGHHHATPVGVLAGDRGLDQRRVGDREADTAGTLVADGAGHAHLDQLLRALAVADHEHRELAADVVQRRGEGVRAGIVERGQRRVAGLARGERQDRVAGRSVAVDGDASEGTAVG